MEKILNYIEKVTEEKVHGMPWKTVVDTIILPRMAGAKYRWCINDRLMNFLAEFAEEVVKIDAYTGTAMLEIALQRLSCGAVPHEATPWPEPLPQEYWVYSSVWDESHVMTEGCYNFVMKGMETCLKNKVTRDHAIKILFGLMNSIDMDGRVLWGCSLGDYASQAPELFRHAEKLVRIYATFDEQYQHYVRPGEWQKHLDWLKENASRLEWKKTFRDMELEGNWFKRLRTRRFIKKMIR